MKMYCHLQRPAVALACFTVLLLALTVDAQHFESIAGKSFNDAATVDIKNFGKVNDNYYRGSQPSASQFEALKQLGVKTVIDLRKDRVKNASAWAHAAGLRYVNIPLTTKKAATAEQTTEFLKLVNDPANWPVYVHCKGGRHRTGQMTAILRITNEGWTGDQAYAEMKRYDFENNFFYPRSLKKYVFSYYKEFTTRKNLQLQTASP